MAELRKANAGYVIVPIWKLTQGLTTKWCDWFLNKHF